MGRQKRKSKIITSAEVRLASIQSIDPNFDLGNGNTAVAYQAAIDSTQDSLDTYNTLLSTVDEAYNNFLLSEKALKDLSEAMLIGVAAMYGKDSNEYEQAGGTRKSERKRPVRAQDDAAGQ